MQAVAACSSSSGSTEATVQRFSKQRSLQVGLSNHVAHKLHSCAFQLLHVLQLLIDNIYVRWRCIPVKVLYFFCSSLTPQHVAPFKLSCGYLKLYISKIIHIKLLIRLQIIKYSHRDMKTRWPSG
jgi:hypothetical protein